MKLFQERNPLTTGAIGIALTASLVLGALNYTKLPFVNHTHQYSAYFAESGGLLDGSVVQVSGVKVGQVRRHHPRWPPGAGQLHRRRRHRGRRPIRGGHQDQEPAGREVLELTPRGEGTQSGTIPVERTRSPYQLPDALGDLAATIGGLNTNQVSHSLQVLADTFKDTPADVKVAVQGVARFSQTLDERDAQLRSLLANANKVTGVLAERSDQVVSLIADTNALLIQLQSQSTALDQIAGNISAVTARSRGPSPKTAHPQTRAGQTQRGPDDRRQPQGQVQDSIKRLNAYAMSLGESVSRAVLQGLPGQPAARSVRATVRRRRVLRPPTGSARALAITTSRPADRPAGHPRAPEPLPAHRAGRRTQPAPARRHHREPGRSPISLPRAAARSAPRRTPAGTASDDPAEADDRPALRSGTQ